MNVRVALTVVGSVAVVAAALAAAAAAAGHDDEDDDDVAENVVRSGFISDSIIID